MNSSDLTETRKFMTAHASYFEAYKNTIYTFATPSTDLSGVHYIGLGTSSATSMPNTAIVGQDCTVDSLTLSTRSIVNTGWVAKLMRVVDGSTQTVVPITGRLAKGDLITVQLTGSSALTYGACATLSVSW